jgi:hypothetical protein
MQKQVCSIKEKPYILPKPTSPYAALNFPAGIPVTHPIPVGMSDGNLLWDLDLDRTTAAQLLLIAQLVATARSIHIDEVITGIKATQNFGIAHHHVDQLIGDDTTADDLEAFGRAYRVKHFLMRSKTVFAMLTINDAIVMYCETTYALFQLNPVDSECRQIVDLWMPVIIRSIEQHSPPLAKILRRSEVMPSDLVPYMSVEYFDTVADIEIELPIPAYTAYLLCAVLQLRLRDPECPTTEPIRHYIKMLEGAIVQLCPEASWLMERNWHPEFDEVRS